MKYIFLFLQNGIKHLLIFLLLFIWLKFALNSFWLSFVIAVALTMVIELIMKAIRNNKKNKQNLKLSQKEDAENMFVSLATSPNSLDFFYDLFSSRHNRVEKCQEYIVVCTEIKTVFFPYLKLHQLTADDLFEISSKIKTENINKLVIICNDYDKTCQKYLSIFPFETIILDK